MVIRNPLSVKKNFTPEYEAKPQAPTASVPATASALCPVTTAATARALSASSCTM